MKVATILPTPLLGMIEDETYHMCLYQEVMSQPEYARFYADQARRPERFVLMDNGAAEGSNPTGEQLLEGYYKVLPHEVIMPDVVYDMETTLAQTKAAHDLFQKTVPHVRLMGVPQGQDFEEWTECLKQLLELPGIVSIGVSKFVTPKYQAEMGAEANVRLECVDMIETICQNVGKQVNIHLLGCHDNPTEVGEITDIFGDSVRGTDSAVAYVYTLGGLLIEPGVPRPLCHIDFMGTGEEDIALLSQNIQIWKELCQGTN